MTVPPFADRSAAGRDLAARLADIRVGSADLRPIVFGVPRGGITVAFEVAQRPKAELRAVVVTKVRAPEHPEYALGAVGPGGTIVPPEDFEISSRHLTGAVQAARREQRRMYLLI